MNRYELTVLMRDTAIDAIKDLGFDVFDVESTETLHMNGENAGKKTYQFEIRYTDPLNNIRTVKVVVSGSEEA